MRIWRQPSTVHIVTDQKQLDNVQYLNYLQSLVTNDAIYVHAVQSRISMAEAAFWKKNNSFKRTDCSDWRDVIIIDW